ncbi:MAG: CopD family protein [Methylovirgula sp.]
MVSGKAHMRGNSGRCLFFIARSRRRFASDGNRRSPKFNRVLDEVPMLFMIAIIVLVVVKPFA